MKITLEVGKTITNDQLAGIFNVSTQGGMRPSKKNKCLVLISKEADNFYPDRWEGDTLYYTGMGQKGDQDVNFRANRTLNESNNNGITVYLFVYMGVNQYIFYGQVKLIQKPYMQTNVSDSGEKRQVVIFPIRPIKHLDKVHIANKEVLHQSEIKQEQAVKKMPIKKLIESVKTHEQGKTAKTSCREVTTTMYVRNANNRHLALYFSKGVCQLCGEPAPFKDKTGQPYLEVHHIDWLSQGGKDVIENEIAICPNCHRKMHIIQDPNDVLLLKEKARSFAVQSKIIEQ
ncbi:MAG: HNH endonuclease [Lentilactobacillus diolivorans]|jgi:5-methylcytosine-specific restriction protein A|nr:HNH endonuclease [Lentilactobacillus diolivorans]RRG03008.1 MAG: HNH endonuclease [Lactobacillus sp.]